MDTTRLIELVATIGFTIGAMFIKDLIAKATTRQRVEVLENAFSELKGEIGKLDDTLGVTNQSLSAINATVKGLAHWLERTENRLNNL